MSLNQDQWRFADMVADLIEHARFLGYRVSLGEAYRPPVTAAYYAAVGKGVTNSFHCKRLAIDIMLFKNGVYLTKTEDYRELGLWWESLDSKCTWGGRFRREDGVHFSYGEGRGSK